MRHLSVGSADLETVLLATLITAPRMARTLPLHGSSALPRSYFRLRCLASLRATAGHPFRSVHSHPWILRLPHRAESILLRIAKLVSFQMAARWMAARWMDAFYVGAHCAAV